MPDEPKAIAERSYQMGDVGAGARVAQGENISWVEGVASLPGGESLAQQFTALLERIAQDASLDEDARELVVSTESSPPEGLLVAVGDSGPGVAAEDRERIFESFFTTKAAGVGIGLSICRSIIEAHGGRLWADAHQPRGAVFRFTLPVAH